MLALVADRAITITSERELVAVALALGGGNTGGKLSRAEEALLSTSARTPIDPALINAVAGDLESGGDPLGEAFRRLRTPVQRRALGAFYTPGAITEPMVDWVLRHDPDRVVDVGCGSGRFACSVARRAPSVAIEAIDSDPLATLMTRAALAVLGVRQAKVTNDDITRHALDPVDGRTAFIGNPPYVRHHALTPAAKAWAAATGRKLGVSVSGLSGLHTYFFLVAALHSRPSDVGCFVTSSEWLDVGYGSAIRQLLLTTLDLQAMHVLDQAAAAFEDAQTTAVITCWEVGARARAVRVRRASGLHELADLDAGVEIQRHRLGADDRWTRLTRPERVREPGLVRLGDLVSVHRGMVTGANDFFVLSRAAASKFGIEAWCVPAITDGKEILDSNEVIRDAPSRRQLLRIPRSIDRAQLPALDRYLRAGERAVDEEPAITARYICSHRSPWWFVGAQESPPIVASYMARQPPRFALNPDRLALINIGHGLYPRQAMSVDELERLVASLNAARASFAGNGRTYQGGLEKFEPRELEDLLVPWPDQ